MAVPDPVPRPHTSAAPGRAGRKHGVCITEEDPDKPTQALNGPCYSQGFSAGKGYFCSMGKAQPCGCSPSMRPGPTAPRERIGKGSFQAELLATPAATSQRGTTGSEAHRSAEEQPENSSTSQEGPPDPTHQDPMLQTCPSAQDLSQQHQVHQRGST